MQTILIIEDETHLAELVAFKLDQAGYTCLTAGDGIQGLEMARRHLPDLVLLDLMLPGMLGLELCRALKKTNGTVQIPVIMLSARGEEHDRVAGFEAGADDYLVKPFSMTELMLRVKAVLRAFLPVPAHAFENFSCINVGTVTIDAARHVVAVDGTEEHFTTTEFKLLHTLVQRRGRVQSRDVLLRDVWGGSRDSDGRTVDTHITRLRCKLGIAGKMIKTVRGFGYKLEEAII